MSNAGIGIGTRSRSTNDVVVRCQRCGSSAMPSFKGKEILDVVHWHNTTLLDGVLERVPLVVGGGVVLLVGGGRWSFVPAVFSLLLSSVGWVV